MKFKNKRIQKLYFKIYFKIALKKVEKNYFRMVNNVVFKEKEFLKKLTPYNGPNIIMPNDGEFVWKVPVNN